MCLIIHTWWFFGILGNIKMNLDCVLIVLGAFSGIPGIVKIILDHVLIILSAFPGIPEITKIKLEGEKFARGGDQLYAVVRTLQRESPYLLFILDDDYKGQRLS